MEYFFGLFIVILGLVIGSFLNCLIWRLYKNESLLGRSYCPRCRRKISWYDNIPLLSFLFLRGRCRHCRKTISWQYPVVEAITALLFLLLWLKNLASPDFSLLIVRDWLVAITLIIVFVYDFRWQLVPMLVVWPMTALVFVLNLLLGFSFLELIIYGLIGAAFFLIQYIITKKKGLGEGDIWLGLFLGITFPSGANLFLVIFLSYLIGALTSSLLLITKEKAWKSKIALGPFLALGAIITLIWGSGILNWYTNLFWLLK